MQNPKAIREQHELHGDASFGYWMVLDGTAVGFKEGDNAENCETFWSNELHVYSGSLARMFQKAKSLNEPVAFVAV